MRSRALFRARNNDFRTLIGKTDMHHHRIIFGSHPEAVREYSRIKEEGAALYPFDIEKYIEHKSPFVEKIYSEIGI